MDNRLVYEFSIETLELVHGMAGRHVFVSATSHQSALLKAIASQDGLTIMSIEFIRSMTHLKAQKLGFKIIN